MKKKENTKNVQKSIAGFLFAAVMIGGVLAAVTSIAVGADVSTISFVQPLSGVDGDTSGWSSGDNMVLLPGAGHWDLLDGTADVDGYNNSHGVLTHRGTRGLGVNGQENDEVDSYDRPERIEVTFDTPHRLSYLEVRSLFDNEGPGGKPEEGDIDLYLNGAAVASYHLIGVESPGTNGVQNVSFPDILVDRIKFYVNGSQDYANYSEFAVAKLDVEPLAEYGDAPDPSYPSKFSSDGARHNPTDSECLGLWFTRGDWKDFETDANVPDADLFDDGLLTTSITAGKAAEIVTFEVTDLMAPSDLYVNILIDLNRDGDWDNDPGEHVVVNQVINIPAGQEIVVTSLPFSTIGATPGATWLRMTLTRHQIPNPSWNGTMADTGLGWDKFEYGETEDWEIVIEEEPTPTPTPTPTPPPEQVPAITPPGFLLALISLFGLAAFAMGKMYKR